jgi:hypothetical protein
MVCAFGRLGRMTTGKKFIVKLGGKRGRSRYYARAETAFKKAYELCAKESVVVKYRGLVVAVFFKGKDEVL